MGKVKKKRFTLEIDAKVIAREPCRYFVARYSRSPSHGYSYHFFLIRPDGSLQKTPTIDAFRQILDWPNAKYADLDPHGFAEQIWDDVVDQDLLDQLRGN